MADLCLLTKEVRIVILISLPSKRRITEYLHGLMLLLEIPEHCPYEHQDVVCRKPRSSHSRVTMHDETPHEKDVGNCDSCFFKYCASVGPEPLDNCIGSNRCSFTNNWCTIRSLFCSSLRSLWCFLSYTGSNRRGIRSEIRSTGNVSCPLATKRSLRVSLVFLGCSGPFS